jgi:hypothetical protein
MLEMNSDEQTARSCSSLQPDGRLKDCLTPVLSALCSLCRFHRPVRKFMRAQVLPPLRDVRSRPEVGNEARNKLCKLLTSPADGVASSVAEFLFILCKESGEQRSNLSLDS